MFNPCTVMTHGNCSCVAASAAIGATPSVWAWISCGFGLQELSDLRAGKMRLIIREFVKGPKPTARKVRIMASL